MEANFSYQKGAALIRMLTYLIGTDTFNKGVSNYLADNTYGNAVQDDLWEKLTEAAHEDGSLPQEMTVKRVMDTWTKQKGYPVVTVTKGDSGNFTFSQERFLVGKSNDTHAYEWWVPVNFVKVGGDFSDTSNRAFIPPHEGSISVNAGPGDDSPLVVNVLEANYYREGIQDVTQEKMRYSTKQQL